MISLLLLHFYTQAQTKDITGFIINENGEGYKGANIVLSKNLQGTVSDKNGEFIFENISILHSELIISAVGYKNITIPLRTDTLAHPIVINLTPQIEELKEIKVKAKRNEKLQKEESISIQLVEEEFLKEAKAATLMQTLKTIPGVNSMDIGSGISKPMIRGMGFYRVVVAQNGIKVEGQQWSNHHGLAIDQQAVNHVEIIKGPASLQYGSDAIGGVINILPPHVPLKGGFNGDLSLVAKSNTQWLGGSTNITWRNGDFYTNCTFSHNNYGDFLVNQTDSFLSPSSIVINEYASHKIYLGNQVHNTAGYDNAASAVLGIVKPWGNSYLEVNAMGSKYGFFDWEGLRSKEKYDMHNTSVHDIRLPNQQVHNFALHHFTNIFHNENKLELAIGYQNNQSNEVSFFEDSVDIGLLLETFTGNVVYRIKNQERQQFKLGANFQFQKHDKYGIKHILPKYNKLAVGGFLAHKFKPSEKWVINSGARLDLSSVNMEESLNKVGGNSFYDSIFNPEFQKIFPSWALSFGVNYLPSNRQVFKVNIGRSYRTPSLYELGAYGLHRHEGRFEKGNVDNNPESAWQFDLGFEQKWKAIKFLMSPFVTYFTNYLFLTPTPDYAPGLGQIYEYTQSKTFMSGGEVSLKAIPQRFVEARLGAEYVYAVNLKENSALPFTPPFNAQTEIIYIIKDNDVFKKSKIGMEWVSVAPQKYTVPNELSTPGYNLVNLKVQSDIKIGKQSLSLLFKVRNMFNTKYYNHISFYRRMRIPEPSRDFQVFVTYPFGKNY